MKHVARKTRRTGAAIAALAASVVALAAPADAFAGDTVTTTSQTFAFAYSVPCTGELAVVEGTLRVLSISTERGGSVVRLTWTHFHGTGYQFVGGAWVPTGTRWVFSGTSGHVLIVPSNDGTRLRQSSVLRLTSLSSAPNLQITLVAVLDFNPETQQFETRVEKETVSCG